MSTMALSEQGGARGAEPYLAAECEEAAIGLVLIDEGLKSGVDDFNLAPQAGEVTRAGDEIVAKVDDRPTVLATVGREIRRRVGRIAKDVPPAQKQALNSELGQLSKNVESEKTNLTRLEPVLTALKEAMKDKKITPAEAERVTKLAHDANGPAPKPGQTTAPNRTAPSRAAARRIVCGIRQDGMVILRIEFIRLMVLDAR